MCSVFRCSVFRWLLYYPQIIFQKAFHKENYFKKFLQNINLIFEKLFQIVLPDQFLLEVLDLQADVVDAFGMNLQLSRKLAQ